MPRPGERPDEKVACPPTHLMDSHSRALLETVASACLALVPCLGIGCIDADGSSFYSVEGRLTGPEQGSPVTEAAVLVALRGDALWSAGDRYGQAVGRTDSDGRFVVCLPCRPWSRTLLFGIIPLDDSEDHTPPPLERVYLQVRQGTRTARCDVSAGDRVQERKGTNTRGIAIGEVPITWTSTPSRKVGSGASPMGSRPGERDDSR